MNIHLRRATDYADMPRQIAWILISIKEVGFPVVVTIALMYIVFVSQERMTTALNKSATAFTELKGSSDKFYMQLVEDDKEIIENQRLIINKIR